ncbi:hypothetical protein ABZ318_00635 [Streptomyces sp. NPDC006197]|uniref:hypothetical protein n=1 Tax=Streptomyces sp. NPDC006197 TaxID=3156685 RepID=UPI0033AB244C
MRDLLDPAFGTELMLPPADPLLSDLTTPTGDVTTGVRPRIQVERKKGVARDSVMNTTARGFAAPQDAADARRQGRRLRCTQQESPWFDHHDIVLRIEAEAEEWALLLALVHVIRSHLNWRRIGL